MNKFLSSQQIPALNTIQHGFGAAAVQTQKVRGQHPTKAQIKIGVTVMAHVAYNMAEDNLKKRRG